MDLTVEQKNDIKKKPRDSCPSVTSPNSHAKQQLTQKSDLGNMPRFTWLIHDLKRSEVNLENCQLALIKKN